MSPVDINLQKRNINIAMFLFIMIIFLGSFWGQLDMYQTFQLGIGVLALYSTIIMVYSTTQSAAASKLQAEAAIETLKASVAPKLHFRIRPANRYWNWNLPRGITPRGWQPGVGLFIENLGLGPAININLKYTVNGNNNRSHEHNFPRLHVGGLLTIPSDQYPQLQVESTDYAIIIEEVEFEDIRTPTNHYSINEKQSLNIVAEHFKEPDKPISS